MENSNEIDLLAELAKATETKPEANEAPAAAQNTDVEILQPLEEQYSDDFAPPPPPEPDHQEPAAEEFDVEDLTDVAIFAIDMLFSGVLPMAYRNTLPSEDRDLLNSIIREKKKGKDENLTPEMKAGLSLYNDYLDYIDNSPMTKPEANKLKKPLAKELEKYKIKMKNSDLLWTTAALIFAPRLIPIAKNKFF